MRTPRDHALAALIALHLFAITAAALPSAGAGLDRAAWSNPTVQEEFSAWTGRLQAVGLAIDSEQLQDVAFGFASGWGRLQHAATAPFGPYYRYAGTTQSWRMFVAPHRYPARLEVDLDRGEGWEPLYVMRSAEHDWRRRQLDQDRFRSAIFRYGWKHVQRRGRYDAFVRWLARQAAHDFPEAHRIRTRFWVYRTRPPEAVRAGIPAEGHYEAARVVDLAGHR